MAKLKAQGLYKKVRKAYAKGEITREQYLDWLDLYWAFQSYPHGSGLIEPPSTTKS